MMRDSKGRFIKGSRKEGGYSFQNGNQINKGRIHTKEWKIKVSEKLKGRKMSEAFKEKRKLEMLGEKNPNFKKKYTDEEKNKIRKSALKYLENVRHIKYPCIGRFENPILNNLEKCLGYIIKRQKQIGGYFVDGYCEPLNLVIEIDEPSHNKMKDMIRENNIKKEINCQFLRIAVGGN